MIEATELVKRDLLKRGRVLFVIDTLQIGGAEQSLLENISYFRHLDSVICHLYPGEILKPAFTAKGIKVYSLNIQRKFGFLIAYLKLRKVISIEKPDLIVAYLTRSEIISRLAGRLKHIPVVGTFVNDLYCKEYNQHLSLKAKTLIQVFKQINRITSKICVGFVSNSQSIKEANSKHLHIPLNKIEVINRGRNSYKIKRKNFQSHYNSSIKFLNVSRLFTVKGQKILILGFKKFLESYADATLDIIGDGPLRKELNKMTRDEKLEDKVFLHGSRNDIASIISDYDCFIFPSLVEGFSGAIIEAMFAGIPVLASDIPQNKEAITHLETGYLFKSGSADEVKSALLWYKNNMETANQFAINAYEFAKENFEQRNIAAKLENYLLSTIVCTN